MAAVDRQVDAEVLGVLGDDRGLGAGRPHHDGLGVGVLDLGELRGHVGVARVESLVGDDLHAGLGRRGLEHGLAVLAEPAGVRDQADLGDAVALHVVAQGEGHDDGVGPRRGEDQLVHRVGNDRAAGHGDLRDAGALHVAADGHGGAGAGGADDGHDLVLLDQPAGGSPACASSVASSSMMTSTGRPLMPPASLIFLTSISMRFFSGSPRPA